MQLIMTALRHAIPSNIYGLHDRVSIPGRGWELFLSQSRVSTDNQSVILDFEPPFWTHCCVLHYILVFVCRGASSLTGGLVCHVMCQPLSMQL
jgi:hypothetical protein